jgi:hypothetical protein
LAIDTPSLAGLGDADSDDIVLDAPVAPAVVDPVVASQPAPVASPPGASKYGGRSPEELAGLLEERDIQISRSLESAALAAHDAQYFRTLSEVTGSAPAPAHAPVPVAVQAPPPLSNVFDPKSVVTEEEFIRDPVGAAHRIAVATREFERRQDDVRRVTFEARAAQRNFVEGRTNAFTQTPALFNGLEHQVSEYVAASFRDRLITADQIREPKTWQWVAQLIRSERGEMDFSKYYKTQAPAPIPASHTELPNGRQTTKAPANLTPEQRELVRIWGKDEAEFIKAHDKRIQAEGV